ncbi:MAG: hypothetical protein HUK23_03020 [Sphaerochaetaceae bacterium]|nr:hypothetical protein [Sphaerochaetaceae bacterium]
MAWLVGAHMEMNILENVMSNTFKKVILYLTQIAGIVLGWTFIRAGLRAIKFNKGRIMSIMGFDEMWRYIPLVVCGVLLIICVVFHLITMIMKDTKKKSVDNEETK